jgi:iron complex outermembrane receptor protein
LILQRLAGISSVTLATTSVDLPYRIVDNRRAVQRYQIGADGQTDVFGKAVSWDVYGQYGRADLREQLRNVQNIARIANATNAVTAQAGNSGGYAAGSIQCAINVDPNPANDDKACVPLNRLGIGVADPAAIAYVLGAPYRDETTEQKTAGLNLRASPFRTWAGDVSVAVGGEWREERIRGYVPQQFQPVSTANAQGQLPAHQRPLQCEGGLFRNCGAARPGAGVQRRGAWHGLFDLGHRRDVEAGRNVAADP